MKRPLNSSLSALCWALALTCALVCARLAPDAIGAGIEDNINVTTGTAAPRVAIFKDALEGVDAGLAETLRGGLAQRGMATQMLDAEALANPQTLNAHAFDCLILTHSPDFPLSARDNLQAFLSHGGDAVLLGGHPFMNPLVKKDGRWRPAGLNLYQGEWLMPGEILARMAVAAGPLRPLIDLERTSPRDFTRSTSVRHKRTQVTLESGPRGRALRLDIKGLTGWDVQMIGVKGKIPAGDNVLGFWAKGDAATPQLLLEVLEPDGSRWVKKVDLSTEWRRYALCEQQIGYLDGGTKKNRGDKGDRLNLAHTHTLCFGLAFGLTRQRVGDHTVWIDRIATTRADIPDDLDTSSKPVMTLIGDYEPQPLGVIRSVSYGRRNPSTNAHEDRVLSGTFEGYAVHGFEVPGRSAFVPQLTARDGVGRELGCVGGLTINYGGPYAGSNWFVSGIRTSDCYKNNQDLVADLATLINSMRGGAMAEAARRRNEALQAQRAPYPPFNYCLGTQTFSPTYQFTGKNRLIETAEAIRDLGSNTIKLSLSHLSLSGYRLPPNPQIRTLRDLLEKEPSYRQVLAMPFDYYLFWAYPLTGNEYWRDGFSKRDKAHEYREMYDAAAYLLKTYSGTHKTFFFGHWEGDWGLLGSFDDKRTPSDKAVTGMIEWLNVRQQAIDDAKRDTPHHDVQVYNYTEVTAVRKAMAGGKTATNDVLPKTHVDFVSYSSYDSLSSAEGIDLIGPQLKESLDYLESKLPPKKLDYAGRRVMLGEYGFATKQCADPWEQDACVRAVTAAGLEWGCPFVLYWEMYDNDAHEGGINAMGFWMIDNHGIKQPVYLTHYDFLRRGRQYVDRYRKQTGHNPSQQEFRAVAVDWLKDSERK